jgi:hypothetical protein
MKKIIALLVMALSLSLFSYSCGSGQAAVLSTPTQAWVPATPTSTPGPNTTPEASGELIVPLTPTSSPTSELIAPLTPTSSPTRERFHLVSATSDPANLTPSVRSQQLADALITMSDELPCQDDSGSPSVKAYASEVQLGCTQTNGDIRYSIFLDFRLGGFPIGLECFHGYLASSDESSFPVQEVNANNEVTKSYLSKGRLFRWFAQGIDYTVLQRIDGGTDSDLPPSDLQEKIYAELMRTGFITSEGNDCTP